MCVGMDMRMERLLALGGGEKCGEMRFLFCGFCFLRLGGEEEEAQGRSPGCDISVTIGTGCASWSDRPRKRCRTKRRTNNDAALYAM